MADKFNAITDEQLAAFLDGKLSETEGNSILDAVQTKEDLETLALALDIKKMIEESDGDLSDMPDINEPLGKLIEMRPFGSLPMTGFLGNDPDDSGQSDDEAEED